MPAPKPKPPEPEPEFDLKSYLEKKQNDYQDKLIARKQLEDKLWENNLIRKKTGNYKVLYGSSR